MATSIKFIDENSIRVFSDTTYDSEIDLGDSEDQDDDEENSENSEIESVQEGKGNNTETSKNKNNKRSYRWRYTNNQPLSTNTGHTVQITPEVDEVKTPLEYFKDFFDDDMISLIADQTNLYSAQNNIAKGSIATNSEEIQNYLGILLRMCVVHMPKYHHVPVEKLGYHGADVVMRLCHHLPKDQNYKLFFDNFFNYLELLVKLKEKKIWAIGTLRADRMRGCKLKSEKELKKEGRGSLDGAVDFNSGVTVVRWYDNRAVQLASNYAFIDPLDIVRRFSKSERQFVNVPRPLVVKLYNADMGGVDLFDMFRALYSLDHKSKRWYMKIFFWILATSAINGWLMYRRHCKHFGVPRKEQMPLLLFICQIADAVITSEIDTPRSRRRGRPSLERSLEVTPVSKRPRRAPDLHDTPSGISDRLQWVLMLATGKKGSVKEDLICPPIEEVQQKGFSSISQMTSANIGISETFVRKKVFATCKDGDTDDRSQLSFWSLLEARIYLPFDVLMKRFSMSEESSVIES
eukprot:gene9567-17318_t